MYGWDTAQDQTPADALIRATPWLTPDYASNAIAAARQAGADANWLKWTKARAYAQVTLETSGEDRPPDTATTAWRSYIVTIRMRDAAGHRVATQTVTAFVQLTRATASDPWRIAQIRSN